jgi:copper chaperone CopZ
LKIIQGQLEEQTVTGNGRALQSYNFQAKKPIENEMVYVTVNGEPYEVVDSLYDMTKGDKLCILKTGISGGIDLYFGNEDFGTIPPLGSNVTVKYILTDGFQGNIFSKSNQIKFKWDSPAYTNTGEEIDLNEVFDIYIEKPIILGADSEDPGVTKLIAPKTSRALVLANPDNYISLLSRFNYSYVNAYTTYDDEYLDDDNIVYLFLIPDVQRRLNSNTDYFTTPLTTFYLDPDEKEAVYSYINRTGQQIVTTELSIVDPILTRYTLNIFLRVYDTIDQNTLKNEIINQITEYFLKVTRRDKVPKSDLIAIIENVKGVDSVNISFVSEINEDAINDGYYIKQNIQIDRIRGIQEVVSTKITLNPGEDPNIGLDDFGDIKIGLNELPVIRGGWYDRYGNYYEEGLSEKDFSSINVIIKSVIPETLSTRITMKNKDSIK